MSHKHKRRQGGEESGLLPDAPPVEAEDADESVEVPLAVVAPPGAIVEPDAAISADAVAPPVAAAQPPTIFDEAPAGPAAPVAAAEAPIVIVDPPAAPPAQPPPAEADAASSRDSGTLNPLDFPEHPFPETAGARLNRFQAVIKRSALNAIHRHGASKPDVEVCGVLVGNVYHDRAGPFLYIEDVVRGDYAANNLAQVTFTAQTWQHIQAEMESKHPEQKIVGWYHTHPDFGIFLSKMDLFIHESFFNIPWQAAFVYDPKRGDEGLFLWKKGLAERDEFLVQEDWASAPPEEVIPQSPEDSAAQAASATALTEIKIRLRRLERRNRFLLVTLVLFLLAAAVWPFVLFTIMSGGDFAATWRLLGGDRTPATQHD